MVATFSVAERNRASGSQTGSITTVNFTSTDSPQVEITNYPIAVGANSYEKYLSGNFSGTFTKIDNVQFWMSAGSYGTGEVILWGSTTTYTQPVSTISAVALGSTPTADPTTANVLVGGSLAGSLTAAGSTDYVVLQYQTAATASAGSTNEKTFTFQWDEI